MPQYMGSAHGTYQSSVDITTLLTIAPRTTVTASTVGPELAAQQRAGVLPAPDPLGNTIYAVHFPPGITITDPLIGNSCVQWCAYHDFYINQAEHRYFTFTVTPDLSQDPTCMGACGIGTPLEVYTENLSHELLETVTDPWGGSGWENTCSAQAAEIADVCTPYKFYVPRRTASTGTPACPNRWAMSTVFSNAAWNPNGSYGCVVADATQQNCVLGVVPDRRLAATLELSAPQPIPAVDGTRLRYSLPLASFVRLDVADVTGR